MSFNPNEVVIERVKELVFSSKDNDGDVLARLTQLEDSSLETTSEQEDVVDAIGSVITSIYRAKAATFTASNSLLSLNLAALQMGAEKELATTAKPIVTKKTEVLEAEGDKITLSKTPEGNVKFIYKIVDGNLSEKYTLVTGAAGEKEFTISDKEITLPAGTTGRFYVIYDYSSTSAVKIENRSDKFPENVKTDIITILKDTCNPNIKYYGVIHSDNSMLDPSSVTLGLTATGKHPFTVKFLKPYCDEEAALFDIVIPED